MYSEEWLVKTTSVDEWIVMLKFTDQETKTELNRLDELSIKIVDHMITWQQIPHELLIERNRQCKEVEKRKWACRCIMDHNGSILMYSEEWLSKTTSVDEWVTILKFTDQEAKTELDRLNELSIKIADQMLIWKHVTHAMLLERDRQYGEVMKRRWACQRIINQNK